MSDVFQMRGEAFERLYAVHAEPLVKFLLYRTGDTALAEDLAADTFERVIRARRPFDPRRGTEKAWLYTIALNLLRDHERRRAAEMRALRRSADPERDKLVFDREDSDIRGRVARALSTLGTDEREIVALRYGADLSTADIAKIRREKAATVEKRLYRAMRKLRAELVPLRSAR
jgi:RNA polymerase sigma factor (sigma-70 family)